MKHSFELEWEVISSPFTTFVRCITDLVDAKSLLNPILFAQLRQDTNCIYFAAGKKSKFVFRVICVWLDRLSGICWLFVRSASGKYTKQ